MSEHKKLKEIIDKIDFDSNFIFKDNGLHYKYGDCCTLADVREIIFTTEFINTLDIYVYNTGKYGKIEDIKMELYNHLDNPVDYLYNLIN